MLSSGLTAEFGVQGSLDIENAGSLRDRKEPQPSSLGSPVLGGHTFSARVSRLTALPHLVAGLSVLSSEP